jgi:hypothetical protein
MSNETKLKVGDALAGRYGFGNNLIKHRITKETKTQWQTSRGVRVRKDDLKVVGSHQYMAPWDDAHEKEWVMSNRWARCAAKLNMLARKDHRKLSEQQLCDIEKLLDGLKL